MRGNMTKKAAAACLALLIVTGAMSMQPIAEMTQSVMLTAHAESEQTEGSATLDEDTQTLTLSGHVSRDQVWAAVGKEDQLYPPSKDVTSVVAEEDTVLPEDCSYLFYGFGVTNSIDLSKANTENVTNMSHMFCDCSGLTSLDVRGFNTANVTDMHHMFRGCSGLTSLDVSQLDTQNVDEMSFMFSGCSGLTELDLRSFDTASVRDMSYMFYGCSGLTSLDVSGFNTAKVTDMNHMFYGCTDLEEIIAGDGWIVPVNSDEMFGGDCGVTTTASTAVLDEEGKLTLRGHVSTDQVWKAAGKKNEGSVPTNTVTSVVAAEGTVLPESEHSLSCSPCRRC